MTHNLKAMIKHFNLSLGVSNYELKFLFQRENLNRVLAWLSYNYVQTHEYETETIYFDDQNMNLYTDHMNSELKRFKLRLRRYDGLMNGRVEIKEKNGLERLKWSAASSLDMESLENLSTGFFKFRMSPHLKNLYIRKRFLHNTTNVEITLDSDLRFEKCFRGFDFNDSGLYTSLQSLFILEIKGPSIEDCQLVSHGLPLPGPITLSKYMLGVNFFKVGKWNY